jgi:hypothetical protein
VVRLGGQPGELRHDVGALRERRQLREPVPPAELPDRRLSEVVKGEGHLRATVHEFAKLLELVLAYAGVKPELVPGQPTYAFHHRLREHEAGPLVLHVAPDADGERVAGRRGDRGEGGWAEVEWHLHHDTDDQRPTFGELGEPGELAGPVIASSFDHDEAVDLMAPGVQVGGEKRSPERWLIGEPGICELSRVPQM